MRKNVIKIVLLLTMVLLCKNVYALETIDISNQESYLNAINTINTSNETDFIINLTNDVELGTISGGSVVTISSNKNVQIIGNGNAIKLSSSLNYGHAILIVGNNATITLGKEDKTDTLYIQGAGLNVATADSLINISGTLNIYEGVDISNNYGNQGALSGGALDLDENGTVNMYGGKIHDNRSDGPSLGVAPSGTCT